MNLIKKPWLLLPSDLAHTVSPTLLNLLYGRSAKSNTNYHWKEFEWEKLYFRNPVGTAGGLDKNGANINPWWNLGAGFLELGTVTPLPQAKNEGKTIDRDIDLQALWNCLGFPNLGSGQLHKKLQAFPKEKRITPLFINIGKNRWVENKEAHLDYIYLIETFKDVADAFVINISSPNTKGLRDLFELENFKSFLTPICEAASKVTSAPLLLKLSPDLSEEHLYNIIKVTSQLPIKGWILTNTTSWRSTDMRFAQDKGGVSGKPLYEKSKSMLVNFQNLLGADRAKYLIVSTGGISSSEDVSERLSLGADLTQIYSGLIFKGPNLFKRIAKSNFRHS